jgi:N-acetylated-alpha-linked acidic dipeptidase
LNGRGLAALRTLGLAAACLLLAAAPPRTVLYGYSPPASNHERGFEAAFLDVPSAQGALDVATQVALRPHYAGSPGDHDLAIYMRDKLREYGFEADLETLTAQVDTPKKLGVQLIPNEPVATPEPTVEPAPSASPNGRRRPAAPKLELRIPRRARGPALVTLDLREAPIPGDDATATSGLTLPFNAGSADGNVRAPLVYAAHGLEADYAELRRHDVDVRGAIVLIRYGAQFRGTLAERAQRHGAAGVIFYNDPADDGFARGPVYPNGPWRPPTSVERGTVGAGIKIPTLPISATNAQLLLAALRGPEGPKPWAGALAVAYPYARGPAQVRLSVSLNRRTTTLWNTIGRIRGTRGEQYVIVGAHRDAWLYGVGDNGSGISTLLELARGYGFLLKSGWHPLRTVVVAGWDGEEIGTLGSIAYVKRHREELLTGGVAYLNADEDVVGPRFSADAAAAIAPAVAEAARSVEDPTAPNRSIFEQWAAERQIATPTADAPGGGSDHAPFLFDVGTPVANLAFTGPLGAYHSGYDTLQFATSISDPGFVRHRAAAQLYGILAMRLAGSEAVPYDFSAYVPLMRAAIAQLVQGATATRTAADTSTLQAAVDAFAATATRYDALTARAANIASADRSLEAARILDLVAYSADGYAANLFPDLERALVDANASGFAIAATRTRNAIAHATDVLAGAPGMEVAPPPAAPRRPPVRRPPVRRPATQH